MKHFYITIFLLLAAVVTNAQSNLAKESKLKMQDFLQKFSSSEQLKSATESAYALDSITFENGASKKMTYNSSGLLLTYKYYKNEADKINLYETETNTYNENGQMLTNVVGMYDDWAKKMVDQWKYETTYDAQGRPVTEIEWDAGDDATYALEYDSKTTYTYSDDKIDLLQYTWDNEWELDGKITMYVKWGAGNVPMADSMHVYMPVDGSSDNWLLFGSMTYKYNATNFVSETLTIGYDGQTGAVSYKAKTEITYNNNGDILSDATFVYNPANGEWKTTSKDVYEYNADNQIIREEIFNVAWTAGILAPISRKTYDYDSDGNLETQKEYLFYGSGDLTLSYKDDFTFKNLNTENIMLPSSDVGISANYTDFYDVEFYENGAIDEVEHYSYSYTDTETNEMLEKTGKYYYSKYNKTGTSAKSLNNLSINAFPNPFANEINIKIDNPGEYLMKITSITGQVVYASKILGNTTSHNVSSLTSGLYILSLTKGGENRANYKLIKE